MKKNEIVLDVGGTGVTAFWHFHEGFYRLSPRTVPFHRHQYTEVHCTEEGEVMIATAEESFLNRPGTITAIPPGTVHRLLPQAEGAHHFAFLIDYPVEAITQSYVSPAVLTELIEHASEYTRTQKVGTLPSYISFLCKDFVTGQLKPSQTSDRGFLLHEFFEENYHREICVEDLARELHLSPRQAQRMCVAYTGNTFGKELARYRIEAAKLLLKTDEGLTLTEVASLVGYRSYSGFWKAMKSGS